MQNEFKREKQSRERPMCRSGKCTTNGCTYCHCEGACARGNLMNRSSHGSKPFAELSTSRFFRCLPAAVLSVAAQKVPKEAAQRGVERLAPARRATPPRPPQARYVVFANTHLTGCCSACNLRVSCLLTIWRRKVRYLCITNCSINCNFTICT